MWKLSSEGNYEFAFCRSIYHTICNFILIFQRARIRYNICRWYLSLFPGDKSRFFYFPRRGGCFNIYLVYRENGSFRGNSVKINLLKVRPTTIARPHINYHQRPHTGSLETYVGRTLVCTETSHVGCISAVSWNKATSGVDKCMVRQSEVEASVVNQTRISAHKVLWEINCVSLRWHFLYFLRFPPRYKQPLHLANTAGNYCDVR